MLDAVSFSSSWSAMGSAVLHFLWQGALIGLVAALLLGGLRQRSSAERYAVAYGALLLCLLSFVASYATALTDLSLTAGATSMNVAVATDSAGAPATGSGVTGVVAWCWAVGVLCMAARFALQGYGAHRLKTTAVFEPDASWQRAFLSLKEELGVSRPVRLLRSGLADVPMVVGWLSPVVLVPVSAFTGLSPDQLRSLLAHELAHVRRHDHLLNAAQAVVEIVLFFHPVVWWISKQVRVEREYCCDDSSVRLTGDPRLLAEALTTMETLRTQGPMTRTVLAANGGPLMQRITRILGVRLDGRAPLASWQLPAGLVLAGMLAVAGSAYATPTRIAEGDAVAQDDMTPEARKVWTELQAAVKAGKLTEAQARERFAGWQKGQGRKKAPETDRVDIEKVKAELEAAVKSGRITEAQAKEKLAAFEKRTAEQSSDRANPKKVWARLDAAVKAGQITEAQAKERFAAFEKQMAERAAIQEKELHVAIRRIEEAVHAGTVTPEEGKKRIAEYKQRLAGMKSAPRKKENPEEVIREIQAAVESGRLTPEQGKERIEEYKKSLAERKNDPKAEIEKIMAAVKAGEISREDAAKKMEVYRKALAERQAAQQKKEAAEVIARIEAAVKSGRLTPEQGQEKIEAYKKSLAEKKVPEKQRRQR